MALSSDQVSDQASDLAKIPTTVVTGFLGAGKTTLIRHLIENANGRRLALIVNEFGDIGVDGSLLDACGDEACNGEDDIVELTNGCICCTVADDFIPAMTKLLDRPNPPEHIIIETSGLALPQPLIRAFNWPDIRTRVTVDGVVTVVDAAAVAEGRFAHDEAAVDAQRQEDEGLDHESPLEELFEDQLISADMIILNKTDLLDADQLADVDSLVAREARPGVGIVPARNAQLPVETLLGLGVGAEDDMDARLSHHEKYHAGEDHDHDDFFSFDLTLPAFEKPAELLARVIAAGQDAKVLRIKGFATIEGADMRYVVQAVGPRVTGYFDREWRDGEERATRLVVIGLKEMDQATTTARLAGQSIS